MTVGAVDVILVPQGAEYKAVCRGLKRARNSNTTAIALPVGVEPVRSFLRQWQPPDCSGRGDRPLRILVAGLCGSLSNRHHTGDIVVYRNGVYVSQSGGAGPQYFAFDDTLSLGLHERLTQPSTWATVLTTDTVVRSVAHKHLLGSQWQSTVVDMESYAVCAMLSADNYEIAALRAIADDGSTELPDVGAAIDSQGKLNYGRLARIFASQPLAAAKLIRSSLTGLASLERAIAETQYAAKS